MEPEYIERKALDKALTAAAAHDKDKNRRTWAKAICIAFCTIYRLPTLFLWCTAVTADPTISRGWDGAQSTSTAKVRTTFVAMACERNDDDAKES